MLFLGKSKKNNFFRHSLNRNLKNTTSANLQVNTRLENQKKAFPSRSPLCDLINKFSVTKTKY